MILASEHEWKLVLSGVDRGDFSRAIRDSRWHDTWPNHTSLLDDENPHSLIVSLPVENLTQLTDLLSRVGHLPCDHGIALYCSGRVNNLRVNVNLTTVGSGFEPSGCSLTRIGGTLRGTELEARLKEIATASEAIRVLLAEGESQ